MGFSFVKPSFVRADESHLSSTNYQLDGQLDFSGQASGSENYSIFGISTDINDINFWPEGIVVTPPGVQEKNESNSDISRVVKEIAAAAEKGNVPIATTTAVFVLSTGFFSSIMNLPWLSLWENMWSRMIFLFGFAKKKKKWGIVYDAESNQPVPIAVVRIFDQEFKKLLETQITDKNGRFGFLVKPGKYYINIIKTDYTFPSKFVRNDYHGEPFEVKEDSVISVNIPIDPNVHKLALRLNIISKLMKIFNDAQIPVSILGTVLCIFIYISYPDLLNLLVVIFYLLIWLNELYQLRKGHLFGMVMKKIDEAPIALAIIRVFDEATNKLIATRVTESQGKYYYLTGPGNFYLTAVKENFNPYKVNDLKFSKGNIITEDIGLIENKQTAV